MFTTIQPATIPTVRRVAIVLLVRLKRLLNGWRAAAIAYREWQTAWLASHRAGDRDLNNKRLYRGPIDDALESRAAAPAETPQAALNKTIAPRQLLTSTFQTKEI
jgi:hypothetical protein